MVVLEANKSNLSGIIFGDTLLESNDVREYISIIVVGCLGRCLGNQKMRQGSITPEKMRVSVCPSYGFRPSTKKKKRFDHDEDYPKRNNLLFCRGALSRVTCQLDATTRIFSLYSLVV